MIVELNPSTTSNFLSCVGKFMTESDPGLLCVSRSYFWVNGHWLVQLKHIKMCLLNCNDLGYCLEHIPLCTIIFQSNIKSPRPGGIKADRTRPMFIFELQREKTCLLTGALKEVSIISRCSLIWVFVVRMKKLQILSYPKCAHQWRFCFDCANAQVDLNLR